MTTRRWMVAVAIVAVAFWAEMMRRRSVSYRDNANRYASFEATWRDNGRRWDRIIAERKKHLREIEAFAESDGGQFRASWKPLIDSATQLVTLASGKGGDAYWWAAYWGALRVKYERAVRRPWLPMEPDPPRPSRQR
jgi:hypothetical protein